MTTHEYVHLVTGSYFWSRNKDGGHAVWSAVAENRKLHAHFTAIDAELLAMELSHCGDLDLCWHAGYRSGNTGWLSIFLLLWPWPWPNDLHIRTWPVSLGIHRMCKYELATSRLSKVIVRQTDIYRHTYRQTESTEIINHAASRVVRNVKQKAPLPRRAQRVRRA